MVFNIVVFNMDKIVRCPHCQTPNRLSRLGKKAYCGQCRQPLPQDGHPLTVTDANFGVLVEKSTQPFFLDFWAGWCGPCQMIAPFIAELASDLEGRVNVGKLNVDENPRLARQFGVSSIPTMIIFDQGREVGRISGAVPKEAMLARLRSLGLI